MGEHQDRDGGSMMIEHTTSYYVFLATFFGVAAITAVLLVGVATTAVVRGLGSRPSPRPRPRPRRHVLPHLGRGAHA